VRWQTQGQLTTIGTPTHADGKKFNADLSSTMR